MSGEYIGPQSLRLRLLSHVPEFNQTWRNREIGTDRERQRETERDRKKQRDRETGRNTEKQAIVT